MEEPTELTRHIETYVDSSSTPTQQPQAASLDAIKRLVKTDSLTLEALVRELEMYLTTTDNVVRARGAFLFVSKLAIVLHVASNFYVNEGDEIVVNSMPVGGYFILITITKTTMAVH